LWQPYQVSRLNIQSGQWEIRLEDRNMAAAQAGQPAGSYDAIVVGGGHNGLVAAAYLARSGARTLVLEGRGKTGGAATTEAPWPDAPEFKVTRLSYVMSLLPPTIIKDLELARHGYKIYPMGPYYQAFPEGGSIKLYADDARRNHEEVSKWSKKDADAMPRWDAWLAGLAEVLGPLLLTVPPNLGSRSPRDLRETLRLAWRHRGLDVRTIADVTRLMTMSIADLLDDWFESPQVKGALAVNGVIGTWAGPYEPGTAYVMAHHSIGDVGDGHLGNWGFQEGGMGAVSSAIEAAAVEHGAEVRLNAKVARILVADGRAAGVALDNGDELRAKVVVSTLHPRTAFLDQVGREHLPPEFTRDIEHWKTRSGVVKINLALGELPDFAADPGSQLQEHHTGSVEMAPTMEYIEEAFQDARTGRPATRPFSDGVIPTAFDKTLSPEGTHIMSLFTQWVPADWSEQPHTAELEAYADRMIDCYNELAPNFKSSILHRDIVGPHAMEQEYGLVGGNIFHGELSLEQLFHMRPAPGYADYRTPLPGMYYGSSATHAGGGVCGIPGWQAARAAIADQKAARRSDRARRLTRRS
jgi:phytoene dehydrogenase-like protein